MLNPHVFTGDLRFRFVSDVIDQHGTLTNSSRMLYILIEVFKSWNFNSVST